MTNEEYWTHRAELDKMDIDAGTQPISRIQAQTLVLQKVWF